MNCTTSDIWLCHILMVQKLLANWPHINYKPIWHFIAVIGAIYYCELKENDTTAKTLTQNSLFNKNIYKYHIRFAKVSNILQITIYSCCIMNHRHAGKGISVGPCALDDVLPHDDLGSGLYNYWICYYIHTMHYSCILSNRNKLFLRKIYVPRIGVVMALCWMIWYCQSFLPGFKCIFQLYSAGFSISWYGYKYHMTLCIGQLHPITVYRIFGCALFSCWVSLSVAFTNSMIGFYFTMVVVIIIGIFMAVIFIWTTRLGISVTKKIPGGRLNKKDGLTRCGDSHVKDKTS